MVSFLKGLLIFVAVLLLSISPAIAQDGLDIEFDSQILNATFNSMPPLSEPGNVAYLDDDTVSKVGYQPGREWDAGALPSEVVEVGDIESGLGAEQLTLQQIAELSGFDLADLTVADLTFLQGVTLDKFLGDIPFLGDWAVSELGETVQGIFGGAETIKEAIKLNPELADLSAIEVFGDLSIPEVPNLGLAQLVDFENIGNQPIANVPGLGDISLADFPNPMTIINVFAKQDIAFGKEEYSGEKPTPDPVSGGTNGNKAWEAIACKGGCPHIELTQQGWKGANWMTKDHRVPDGYGLLGGLFGEAGAYRLPFGDSFALQVASTDEATGTAEWGIAFRACASGGFFDLGCTAYFMEVPLGISTQEGDLVLTGLRDGKGGASAPVAAPPGWEELRPALPPELMAAIAANTSGAGSMGGGSLCGNGPGGVKFEALSEAYHRIESRGQGNYGAVGVPVDLGGDEVGKALGRYQYMSYRADVIKALSARSGGPALLQKARNLQQISAAELLEVFPPDLQDSLFLADQTYMIELAMSKGYEGERLLEVLAQMHFRGTGVLTNGQLDSGSAGDSLGTTLKEYGEKFKNHYLEAEKDIPDSEDRCKSTGKFINPIESGNFTLTRGFSSSKVLNPVTGTYRKHDGDDLGVPQGTPIVASDGGVVEWRDQGGGWEGYGWYMVVQHDGDKQTWYAHLSERLVPSGSRVEQAQVIARAGGAENVKGSGGSTGPHLHFEVRVGGVPVVPNTVVDYSVTAADVRKARSAAPKQESPEPSQGTP